VEAAGRPLRIWSVGCSTGEEAYSLALLAAEALGDDRPPIDVLGTDLSAAPLALAERGLYGKRSMHLVGDERRARWFVADGERLRVGEELRRLVRFTRHNLIHDAFPPAGEAPFDLVVCRNVLIYFDWPTVTRVSTALHDALTPGGELLLGTVDRLGSAPPIVVARTPPPPPPDPGEAKRERSAEAAHAAFETGASALSAGDARTAVTALRRALYLDPRQAVAALQLARAHEALADVEAARRTYQRTLHIVDDPRCPEAWIDDQVAAGDVAAVCRARLAVL
jgi:SAM-dependent methyltransferase